MLRFVVALCSAATVAAGASTSVSRCVHNAGDLPINTYMEGCGSPPCSLPQLRDAVIHTEFKAPRTLSSMTTLATVYLNAGGITIPIPYDLGDKAKTCNYLTNARCPVEENELVRYTFRTYIEPYFPVGFTFTLELRVVDEAGTPVTCIRLPLRITEPVHPIL